MSAPRTRRVEIPGECGTLVAQLYEPDDDHARPAIVINHGSGDDQDSKPGVARLLTDGGYRVLSLYRRGYGESQGPARLSVVTAQDGSAEHGSQVVERLLAESSDVVTAAAFLRELPGVAPDRVAVLGSSYGGITSILAAGRDERIAACVSFAAAAMSWTPVPAVQPLLLAHIDSGRCPVLFLQAANDFELTPSLAMAQRCAERGRDHERVILPALGANALEGHQIWIHAPYLWGPPVFAFLARAL